MVKLKSWHESSPFDVRWQTPPANWYKSIGLLKLLSIYMELIWCGIMIIDDFGHIIAGFTRRQPRVSILVVSSLMVVSNAIAMDTGVFNATLKQM